MHLWTTNLEKPPVGAPIAAFDYDETLGRGVLHWKMLPYLAAAGHIRDPHEDASLAAAYRERAKREQSYGVYEEQLIERARKGYKEAGMSRARLRVLAQEFMTTRSLLDEQYAFTRALFLTLREQGYALVLLSLCPVELVHPVAEAMGFHFAVGNLLATDEQGFFTGEEGRLPVKREEIKTLAEQYSYTFKGSFGIGDSGSDLPMLKETEHAIAFNPKPSFRQLLDTDASNASVLRVVERAEVVTCTRSVWRSGDSTPFLEECRLEQALPAEIVAGVRTRLEAVGYYLF